MVKLSFFFVTETVISFTHYHHGKFTVIYVLTRRRLKMKKKIRTEKTVKKLKKKSDESGKLTLPLGNIKFTGIFLHLPQIYPI